MLFFWLFFFFLFLGFRRNWIWNRRLLGTSGLRTAGRQLLLRLVAPFALACPLRSIVLSCELFEKSNLRATSGLGLRSREVTVVPLVGEDVGSTWGFWRAGEFRFVLMGDRARGRDGRAPCWSFRVVAGPSSEPKPRRQPGQSRRTTTCIICPSHRDSPHTIVNLHVLLILLVVRKHHPPVCLGL